jgi:hypothetical protein
MSSGCPEMSSGRPGMSSGRPEMSLGRPKMSYCVLFLCFVRVFPFLQLCFIK